MANVTLEARIAALEAARVDAAVTADTIWLIFTGSLVFFMQCGFGMLEAGAVRSKATQSIMLKNLFDASLGAVIWWLVGYGFANGGGNGFIGITSLDDHGSYFATEFLTSARVADSSGVDWVSAHRPTHTPARLTASPFTLTSRRLAPQALFFHSFTFSAAAATIVSGAVAERAQLPAYLIFSSMMTGLVYPVVAHWVWSSSGWLSTANSGCLLDGMIDFAGAGVVHMTGGVASLLGAKIIGPRRGRFDESGHPVMMAGHSAVLQVLGTFILWLGWYGFNAGSTLGIDAARATTAGRTVMTTTLSAAAGGVVTVSLERWRGRAKTWDVAAMCNGILAGLVSVTSGCATVMPWSALLIGILGACVYRSASELLLTLRIDDPLDAFAVHGACGCWSVIATALFSTPEFAEAVTGLHGHEGGLLYGGGRLLGAVAAFIVAEVAWVGLISAALFLGLRQCKLLRISAHLDLATIPNLATSTGGGGGGGGGGVRDDESVADGSVHGGQPFSPSIFAKSGEGGEPVSPMTLGGFVEMAAAPA